MIPKIIHYCWLSDDPVPANMQKYIRTWREILSNYEFMKWDFSRFPKETSLWVSQAYDNKKYAFAADYIRLYALYHYGGIYLDMDVEVLKPYDSLLNLPSMICYEANGKTIEAATIGAEKGAEWVKACLDYYEGKSFINNDDTFNMKPLPQIMQKILSEQFQIMPIESNKTIFKRGCVPILPSDYFSPRSYSTGDLNITPNTYSIHQFSGSWLPWYVNMERTFCVKFGIRYRDILNRYIYQKKQNLK